MKFWMNGATSSAGRMSLEEPSQTKRRAFAHTIPISGRSFGTQVVGVVVHGKALESVALEPRALQVEPQEWQFSAPLPVDGLPAGRQRLEICVAMADGETITVERTVTIDPAGAYSRFRYDGRVKPRPRTTVATDGSGAPTVLVARVGAAIPGLEQLEASLDAQSYRGFEVLGAAGGSESSLCAALRHFLASSHDWLLIVEEEGALTHDALLELMAAAQRHDDPDALYGDDESTTPADGVPAVRLKPAWSPDLLLGSPYVGPVAAFGRAAAAAALRENGSDPLDIRDLLLRLDTSLARVVHVAHSLFVRTAAPQSAPLPLERPDPPPPPQPCVSAVICTAYRHDHIFDCLRSLANGHGGEPLEVVLVDDGSSARAQALALCEEVGLPALALTYPPPFNFSDASNLGAGSANGSELLFVNDDVEALDGPWLERMRAWLHRPGVGLVGPKLIYPSGRLQHAGVAVGPWRVDNLGRGWPGDQSGPGDVLRVARNTTAVTGACMLIGRELFDALGGFDPGLAIEFGDVDLPLRAAMSGARTVWTPEATLVHHEGVTRWPVSSDRHDWERFRACWEPLLDGCDPFMHPGFDVDWDYEPARRRNLHRSSREPLWSRARADRSVAAGPRGPGPGLQAAARNRRMEMARAESRYLTDQRGTARDALETVMRSRSWRFTRPLRSVAAFFRRG